MALDFVQFVDPPSGSNPKALGGVKAGTNITISADGTISASGGGGGGAVDSVTGSGSGISVSPTTGSVVVQNTGVTSVSGGRGINVSASTGGVTLNVPPSTALVYPAQRFLIAGPVAVGGNGGQGAQTKSYGSFSCTYPSGANRAIVICRMGCKSDYDGAAVSTAGICAAFDLFFDYTLTGASFVQGDGKAYGSNLAGVSNASASRPQSQFLMRSDVLTLNSSTGGSFTGSFTVGQTSSANVTTNMSSLQIIVLPYAE